MDFLSRPGLKLALGSDHAGFELKQSIAQYLREKNIQFEDFGAHSSDRVDYPDYAVKVARAVAAGKFTAGILICGTGIGMSIVANKIRGIRAALCTSEYMAEYSRRHNDANILCLGGRILSPEEARRITEAWLTSPFEAGRHAQRLRKMAELTGRE
jgi:ribose 5-phosphate isomerase B